MFNYLNEKARHYIGLKLQFSDCIHLAIRLLQKGYGIFSILNLYYKKTAQTPGDVERLQPIINLNYEKTI